MGGVAFVAFAEAERGIEGGTPWRHRSQPQGLKGVAPMRDESQHESTPDTRAAGIGRYIDVPQSAGTAISGVRVAIEPADSGQVAVEKGSEEHFAGAVEAVRAGLPIVDQPAYEKVTLARGRVQKRTNRGINPVDWPQFDQPSAAFSSSTRSVRSHGKKSPSGLRPKWP